MMKDEKETGGLSSLPVALQRRYKQYLRLERRLSGNTVEAYEEDLRKFLNYLETESLNFRDVTLDDLHRFIAGLYDIGIHSRSVARIVSGVRSFYRFLTLEKEMDYDPTDLLEMPRIGRHLPEVLTIEEIDGMIGMIDLSMAEGQRNRAVLEVLYSCGLRVSELCELKLSDLFLDEGFIRVKGKGAKERLVPISQKAVGELKNWFYDRNTIDIKLGHEDYVFLSVRRGTKLSRITIFYWVKEIAMQAGIVKKISPHTFRHSFATHMLDGGANLRAIQLMLGHEKIAATEIYTHISRSRLREEILLHHPRNKRLSSEK